MCHPTECHSLHHSHNRWFWHGDDTVDDNDDDGDDDDDDDGDDDVDDDD